MRGPTGPVSFVPLLAAPTLLVAAVALWFVSDQLVTIGPLDRAEVGWFVVVPLLALTPGIAALAERQTQAVRGSRLIVIGISLAIVLVVLSSMLATVTVVGCQVVTGPLDLLPRALATALVAGLSFAAGFATAEQFVRRGLLWVALASGAAVWLWLAALAALLAVGWPAITCVPQS